MSFIHDEQGRRLFWRSYFAQVETTITTPSLSRASNPDSSQCEPTEPSRKSVDEGALCAIETGTFVIRTAVKVACISKVKTSTSTSYIKATPWRVAKTSEMKLEKIQDNTALRAAASEGE